MSSSFSRLVYLFPPSEQLHPAPNYLSISHLTDANRGDSSPESPSSLVAVQDVTGKLEFAALVASSDLTVVDYWAPWCKYVQCSTNINLTSFLLCSYSVLLRTFPRLLLSAAL